MVSAMIRNTTHTGTGDNAVTTTTIKLESKSLSLGSIVGDTGVMNTHQHYEYSF